MAVRTIIHYLGSFLIVVAMTMTVIVDITAPVNDSIYFLEYSAGDASAQFGVFGYCETTGAGDSTCSDTMMGYNPASVVEGLDNAISFGSAREDSTKALTKAFVIHPVGTGLLFIAFLFSLLFAHSTAGSIVTTLVAGIAFIINTVGAILDWVVFSLIRNEINNESNDGEAKYGAAIYLSVVAAALALIGTIIMFFTCCASRRSKRYESRKMGGY